MRFSVSILGVVRCGAAASRADGSPHERQHLTGTSLALAVSLLLSACHGSGGRLAHAAAGAPAARTLTATPPATYRPTATLQELMQFEIDSAADFIWGSVGAIVTQAGTLDRRPRTDAEWSELRGRTLVLVESTNLLIVPGRRVAGRDFPPDAPGVLGASDIQRNIDEAPAAFAAYATSLRVAGLAVLSAVEQRDAGALQHAGEALDDACEACHRANWYPHEIIPALPAGAPASP